MPSQVPIVRAQLEPESATVTTEGTSRTAHLALQNPFPDSLQSPAVGSFQLYRIWGRLNGYWPNGSAVSSGPPSA